MANTTPKHLEVFQSREACRARVLERRRVIRETEHNLDRLTRELDELRTTQQREWRQLVDLTREVSQLLHADVSGLATLDDDVEARRLVDELGRGNGAPA